jgi:hypothetical protein
MRYHIFQLQYNQLLWNQNLTAAASLTSLQDRHQFHLLIQKLFVPSSTAKAWLSFRRSWLQESPWVSAICFPLRQLWRGRHCKPLASIVWSTLRWVSLWRQTNSLLACDIADFSQESLILRECLREFTPLPRVFAKANCERGSLLLQ